MHYSEVKYLNHTIVFDSKNLLKSAKCKYCNYHAFNIIGQDICLTGEEKIIKDIIE